MGVRAHLSRAQFLAAGFVERKLLFVAAVVRAADSRPNIIVILVDDMGFSDLGCYGSEIETPVLDQLAAKGLRFTQFYNTARCSTTRASLLTGQWMSRHGNKAFDMFRTPWAETYPALLRAHLRKVAEQGYAMDNFLIGFTEMWTQEHHKHSAMDQHIHGFGAQIVGFYFLEAPEGSSRVVFHDPRASKLPIDLPETDMTKATIASKMINFEPKPGLLIFANAWLAHAFTRHAADKPIKFVHFNLIAQMAQQQPSCQHPPAEVV